MSRRSWASTSSTNLVVAVCLVVVLLARSTVAYDVEVSRDAEQSSLFRRMLQDGLIDVDQRPAPIPLYRREIVGDGSSSSVPTSTTNSAVSTVRSHTATATSTSTGGSSNSSSSASSTSTTSTAPVYTATSLPYPFDSSLGSNFTQTSCPTFFNSFLGNSTFKSCLPVSLLLRNSLTFFQAIRSPSVLEATLDKACSASLAICSPLMANIASNLIDESNCGDDYARQNPVVLQAYAGLIAYEPLYNATCLKDPTTGDYCYSQAMVNASSPSDSYPYYTPLGINLPSTAQPSCTQCLQQTMNIFAGYASLKSQPLSKTYVGCATQIDAQCGSTFASTQVKTIAGSKTNSAHTSASPILCMIVLLAAATLVQTII